MPKLKISVCVLALNEEKNLKPCLESVKAWAKEIIVTVDNQTTDKTELIAKQFTDKVKVRPHQDMFNINKQWTADQASQGWILWLDADEKVSKKLAEEIKQVLTKPKADGYLIPRKNFIFGKWIQQAGWYPDLQLRLWKKGKLKWPCKSVHEHPKIKGTTAELKEHIIHTNYVSVNQYISKLNQYSSMDAKRLKDEIKPPYLVPLLKRPLDDFIKRFVAWQGYKDGLHGLAVSLLQAVYEMVVVLKVWEINQFKQEKIGWVNKVERESKKILKAWNWWKRELKIKQTGNKLKQVWHKGLRRLNL